MDINFRIIVLLYQSILLTLTEGKRCI